MATEELSEGDRRAIFLALVESQDRDAGVVNSRKEVAKRFKVTLKELMKIEHEGIASDWPPLD